MRILHCCLAAFYIDNYSYQENILPRMHKLQGHDVEILASTETYINNLTLGYIQPSSYFTEDNIPITRIPYSNLLPHAVMKKLRIYKGVSNALESFKPDIIFLHDCQFVSIRKIVAYAKTHSNVKIFVDGHTDFINSATNWISKNILHRIIYKKCAKLIEPYTTKFYGVLPARVDFFKTMYGIPAEKIDLLVMGADTSKLDLTKRDEIRSAIRESLDINQSDFVIVTGGKIDEKKKIHVLMRAVSEINIKEIKLIVFGIPDEQMKKEISELSKHICIRNIGWLHSDKVYNYFMSSDLGFFPGTHSVLWEQAVGIGLPCVFKKWDGMQHVDVGGNCLFLESSDIVEIKNKILGIYENKKAYSNMKHISENNAMKEFSYYEIAQRAIVG